MSRPLFIDTQSSEDWATVVGWLRSVSRVAALTGAGVSAESGLPTFRGGGLWESHRVEDVAKPGAFARDPQLVWRFYNQRRDALRTAVPNAGHEAMSTMGRRLGSGFTLITQNVDGLHQLAGSHDVIELHGTLRRARCVTCQASIDGLEPLSDLPRCACGGLLRPDVVWFEEALPVDALRKARYAAERAHAMLVVGTSANVHPAAGLIDIARTAGAYIIEVNPAATEASGSADAILRGTAARVLPLLVQRWL